MISNFDGAYSCSLVWLRGSYVTINILMGTDYGHGISGVYTCRAINAFGEAAVNCTISVSGDKSISYESSAAANLDNIKQLEDWSSRDIKPREVAKMVLPPKLLKPLRPEHTMPEGKSAHFECQIEPTEGIKVNPNVCLSLGFFTFSNVYVWVSPLRIFWEQHIVKENFLVWNPTFVNFSYLCVFFTICTSSVQILAHAEFTLTFATVPLWLWPQVCRVKGSSCSVEQ